MRHTNRLAHLLASPAITFLFVALGTGCSGEASTPDVPESATPLQTEARQVEVLEAPALPAEPVPAPSILEGEAIEVLASESLDLVVNYGVMLLTEENFDGAIYAFDYVLRRDSKSTFAWYNLACARSLQGQTQGALAALTKAIEFGYDEFDHMQQDTDLDAIRSLPVYRALVAGRGSAAQVEGTEPKESPPQEPTSGPIVAELVGGFRKTTVTSSGGMSFVTDRYLWLYASGQCEDGSKAAGGDGSSSFRNGDGSPESTGTWSATADTLSMRWNDGSTEDYTWMWYDNGVSGVQLLLSAGGSNYRYTQFQ